jgi:uncharacterized membrane protein
MAKSRKLSGYSLGLAPRQVRNVNKEHSASLTALDNVAVWATEHVGTMGFFLLIVIWTLGWLGWNTIGPIENRFDPYPAFVLWLFISNMIQLLLLPLIMIGQNLQNRHAELRADSDYKTNVQAEKEIREILNYLERHDRILSRLNQPKSK